MLRQYPACYAGQHALGGLVTLLLDPGRFDLSVFAGQGQPAAGGLLGHLRGEGLRGVEAALGRQPLGLLLALAAVAAANLLRLALRGMALAGKAGVGPPGGWLQLTTPAGRWVAAGLRSATHRAAGRGAVSGAGWPLLLGLALRGFPQLSRKTASSQNAPAVEARRAPVD